jgi:hypothetical protein
MCEPIVSVAEIQRRARVAFEQGLGLDACTFNWHSPAYATWHAEYRRMMLGLCETARAWGAESQQSHGAPAGGCRVDVGQGCRP